MPATCPLYRDELVVFFDDDFFEQEMFSRFGRICIFRIGRDFVQVVFYMVQWRRWCKRTMDSIDFKSKQETHLSYIYTLSQVGVSFNEIFYSNKLDWILVNQPGNWRRDTKQYNKTLTTRSWGTIIPMFLSTSGIFLGPTFLPFFSCLEPEVNRMKEPQIPFMPTMAKVWFCLVGWFFQDKS